MPNRVDRAGAPGSDPRIAMLSELGPATFEDVEAWYEWSSPDHFWFRWRFDALLRLLRDLGIRAGEPLAALDIGCGRGVLRSQLEESLGWRVDGADLNLGALQTATPGRGRLLYYNVFDARPELLESYDVITVFDVIEHVEDDAAFLAAVVRHLKPGGLLIVNVPATPLLHSRYDDVVGHLRRYDRRSLRAVCAKLGMEGICLRSWGFSLLPVLIARKIFLNFRPHRSVIESGFVPPGRAAEALLRALEAVEHRFFPRPPLGTSLMLAARQPGVPDVDA